jgi:hypothetical protein
MIWVRVLLIFCVLSLPQQSDYQQNHAETNHAETISETNTLVGKTTDLQLVLNLE